jgi:hypothetical protein
VIGLVAARRQRRRRARTPPNSNTATTTMISTHNHVDMAASLVGAGAGQADTTAAHPGKQLPASRRPPGPRSTAALGAGSRGGPCTSRPARRSGLVERVPARPGRRPRAGPVAEPSCHAQRAQPTVSTSTTDEEDPAGGNRPDATTATPTAGYGEAERVCPAWVGEQSKHGGADAQWQTPRRRRRTDGARLRRNPNLCRGRLHRLALPVQPRSTLRDPPRLGPAGDDPHEATPPLSCRGRWSAQHGGRFNVVSHAVSARHLHHSALSVSAFSVVLLARSTT